ncbi:asparagine synthetase B (glutamine-hydrolyzing) [Salinibacter ruber]|uniref:asparagine synthase C-terminal domain-containing protein n=1 Tax=Salinibacter ruber TaxID=146919 RepID=UPI00160CB87F|nr:asparagine synthase C-terminal domain-containing protein [Salinibacter ruber]MBB4067457.1 asparagine synthetase B (glutamine-hydrolyzing) [Salinibacter ruber]
MNMNIDVRKLNSFLHYGYVPQFTSLPVTLEEWLCLDTKRVQTLHRQWEQAPPEKIVEEGVSRIQTLIQSPPSGSNCVPLSGGLDSRAILGGLLDQISADNLTVIVCGVPGARDFEIGSHVAESLGLELEAVDLSKICWTTTDLVDFADEAGAPITLFSAFMYAQILHRGGRDLRYWSGFLGDPLAGSHLRKKTDSTWEEARNSFARRSEFASSQSLSVDGYRPESVLPDTPITDFDILSPSEQLDFAVRQWDFIRPQVLLNGFEIQAPFLTPDWVQFILSLPDAYRRDQRAYKKILLEAYPDLFSLPVKSNVGLPLDTSPLRKHSKRVLEFLKRKGRSLGVPGLGVDPRLNYIDVAASIRSGSLRSVVRENLTDLKKRDLISWVDIEAIWEEHQSGRVDHTNALDVLTSLEIHLKADTFDQ